MVRRYVAGIVAGTAAAVSLTGCLGDGGKSKAAGEGTGGGGVRLAAADVLSKVSDQAGAVKTFRASMNVQTSASGQETRMSGDVAYQLKPQLGMKMKVSHMTVGGRDVGGFEEILTSKVIYMKMPMLAKQTGKPWVKYSLSRLSQKSGVNITAMMNQASQADPSRSVKMFTASKDAHKVGAETIDGTSVTHYQGTYSVKEALAKLGADQRALLQKATEQAGLDTMSFDLWVDAQQLPRKLKMTTPPGSKVTTDTTMIYSGFNEPVSITPPPASQVMDGDKHM